MRSVSLKRLLLAAACCIAAQGATAQPAGAAAPAAKSDGKAAPVIEVGSRTVSLVEFEQAIRQAMRQKFYHGKVPEAQIDQLQREVADQIVNDTLLLAEAQRRGIKPDPQKMQQVVRGYDERYGNSTNWKQNRDEMLSRVMPEMERRDVLEQLEKSVRAVPAPTDEEARAFYRQKPELFTEPEKFRLSVILLRVDPSSPKAAWEKAMEEGQAIHKRIKGGADFAELARLHSGDDSAQKGGDMGYLHRGMLPDVIQASVDQYQIGQVQPPIMTLQGVAILRLDEKVPPRLRSFEDVRTRAGELLKRDRGDAAWKNLIANLRAKTPFTIREQYFAEVTARLR